MTSSVARAAPLAGDASLPLVPTTEEASLPLKPLLPRTDGACVRDCLVAWAQDVLAVPSFRSSGEGRPVLLAECDLARLWRSNDFRCFLSASGTVAECAARNLSAPIPTDVSSSACGVVRECREGSIDEERPSDTVASAVRRLSDSRSRSPSHACTGTAQEWLAFELTCIARTACMLLADWHVGAREAPHAPAQAVTSGAPLLCSCCLL